MDPPPHIDQLLKSLTQFNPVVAAEEEGYRLRMERDAKLVQLLWPSHASEVFFDFMANGKLLLAESVEYYENETALEQAEDIARIVQNYLLNEVKVVESGLFLKRRELQTYRGGRWLSVFESAAQ